MILVRAFMVQCIIVDDPAKPATSNDRYSITDAVKIE